MGGDEPPAQNAKPALRQHPRALARSGAAAAAAGGGAPAAAGSNSSLREQALHCHNNLQSMFGGNKGKTTEPTPTHMPPEEATAWALDMALLRWREQTAAAGKPLNIRQSYAVALHDLVVRIVADRLAETIEELEVSIPDPVAVAERERQQQEMVERRKLEQLQQQAASNPADATTTTTTTTAAAATTASTTTPSADATSTSTSTSAAPSSTSSTEAASDSKPTEPTTNTTDSAPTVTLASKRDSADTSSATPNATTGQPTSEGDKKRKKVLPRDKDIITSLDEVEKPPDYRRYIDVGTGLSFDDLKAAIEQVKQSGDLDPRAFASDPTAASSTTSSPSSSSPPPPSSALTTHDKDKDKDKLRKERRKKSTDLQAEDDKHDKHDKHKDKDKKTKRPKKRDSKRASRDDHADPATESDSTATAATTATTTPAATVATTIPAATAAPSNTISAAAAIAAAAFANANSNATPADGAGTPTESNGGAGASSDDTTTTASNASASTDDDAAAATGAGGSTAAANTTLQRGQSGRVRQRSVGGGAANPRRMLVRGGVVPQAPIATVTIKRSLVSIKKWADIVEAELLRAFPSEAPSTTSGTASEQPLPLTEEAYEKDGRPFTCYFKSVRGPRPQNEDEFTVVEHGNEWLGLQTDRRISYFGMYDGHSGRHAAIYSRMHLHHLIASQPAFHTDIEHAIRTGFLTADKNVNEFQSTHNFNCGTTAISIWLVDDELVVGNVGDSQGVLSRGGKAIELSNPHSPTREDEKERLKAAGGAVVWFGTWRVNGVLAVSRSIGDNNLKHCVIADPEITRFKLGPEDEFLLIATDGLWDVVKLDESITLVKEIERSKGRAAVPSELCEEALRRGSKDNVSIIVVFLCNNQTS